MELLYLYIPDYRAIKDREYNFSNKYRFTRAYSGHDIIIQKTSSEKEQNALWTKNFFGEVVSNITMIVGQNGTGKSTLLKFINEELAFGGNSMGFNYAAIFKNGESFFTKSRWSPGKVSFEFPHLGAIDGINMIQYYPLTDLTFKNTYLNNQIGSGRINVSDNAMIFDDFERELGKNRNEFFQTPFEEALSPFVISNKERELEYFRLNLFNEINPAEVLVIETVDIFDYIEKLIASYSMSVKSYEKDEAARRSFEITLENLKYLFSILNQEDEGQLLEKYKFVRALTYMLFVDVMSQLSNAIGQIQNIEVDKISNEINRVLTTVIINIKRAQDRNELNLQVLQESLKHILDLRNNNLNLYNNAKAIHELITHQLEWAVNAKSANAASNIISSTRRLSATNKTGIIYLFIKEFPTESLDFINQLKQITFSSRVLKFDWKGMLHDDYDFSTGQLQRLKLYSRLNFAFNRLDKNHSNGILVMLDEAELAMHPEWQRTMIRDLLKFIGKIAKNHAPVQVIMTTHSPLMLSDIPSMNVIRLEKDKIENEKTSETFGANLYDLLNDSFFLGGGFIGAFADDKIQKIISGLSSEESNTHPELTLQIIELIGEDYIKEKLLEMFYRKYPDLYNKEKEIERLMEKINSLRNDSNK